MEEYVDYALYLPDDSGLDYGAIGKKLKSDFPNVEKDTERYIAVVDRMVDSVGTHGNKPLFLLARYLIGELPVEKRGCSHEPFFPFALLFTCIRFERYGDLVYAFHEYEGVGPSEPDTVEILFQSAWDAVRYGLDENGKSEDLLTVALKYSDGLKPNHFEGINNSHCRRLLGICEFLHNNNQGTIMLPQERLAPLLNLAQPTICMLIKNLKKMGYLKLEMAGNVRQQTANRYFYISPKKGRKQRQKQW